MLSSTVSIISLGSIVKQDQSKALQAFAELVEQKKPSINSKAALSIIYRILTSTVIELENFKNGSLSERDYTSQIILAIQKESSVLLTIEEFDKAWNTMNPGYDDFKTPLDEAIQLKENGEDILFISNTNPKDMHNLIDILQHNDVAYETTNNGDLISISKIPVFLTYVKKQSKAELITHIIEKSPSRSRENRFLKANNPSDVYVDNSVQYIHSVGKPDDPLLQSLNEETLLKVGEAVQKGHVATIIWDRSKGETLRDAIHSRALHSMPVASFKC